ncbi:acetylcholinesterase-like [Argonauta hians]
MEAFKYVFTLSLINGYIQAEDTTIGTTSGKIKGSTISVLNTDIDVFLGIPFAKPPVGDLRFRRPEPVEPWSGIKETKRYSAACTQPIPIGNDGIKSFEDMKITTKISEDCLYLNIWAPTMAKKSSSHLTTMIWIHAGAFIVGSSSLNAYNGQWLAASENVIIVSLNYRLGPFGFLYLNNKRAPGNMGLLDQNLAIKWIRDNIASFGGDPNKLTIFGESSGSASVGFHVESPLSSNLFNNAIMMSGTHNADWAIRTLEENKDRAKAMAEFIKCPSDDIEKMLDCFLEANATDLANGQFYKLDSFLTNTFCPVIDNHFLHHDTATQVIYKKMKKNILAGFVKNEGSLFLLQAYKNYFPFDKKVPIGRTGTNTLIREITDKPYLNNVQLDMIIYLYGSNVYSASQTDKYRYILERVTSEYLFKCPTIEIAKNYSTHCNVYIYSFEYLSKSSLLPKWMGAFHTSDVAFIFAHALSGKSYSAEDKAVTKKMTSLFTNFSKSGNPNNGDCSDCPSEPWTKFKLKSQKYIVLDDSSKLEMKDHNMNNMCGFWSDILPKLYNPDSQTPQINKPLSPVSTSGSQNSWNFLRTLLICLAIILISLSNLL